MKKKLNYKGESYVPNSLKNRDRLQSEVFDPIVYQNELISNNYKFKSDFPHIKDYNDLEMIRKNFSPLASINKSDIDYNEYKDADFFIIRSSNFDDVHKAIKYGFWTSTEENNKMFADSFRQNQPHKRKTLLVFRVIKERKFIGIAEIISDSLET